MLNLSPAARMGGYITLVPLWLAIAANYVMPFSNETLQMILFWTGIGMAATHLIEVFIFFGKLKPRSNKLVGVLMLFLFGIVYASSLNDEAK